MNRPAIFHAQKLLRTIQQSHVEDAAEQQARFGTVHCHVHKIYKLGIKEGNELTLDHNPVQSVGRVGVSPTTAAAAAKFIDREFPVLGTGGAHQSSNQGWGRASTQSPSQNQGRQTQDDLYQSAHVMDEFGMQRVGGQSQGNGPSRHPRLGSNEDFPALPSSGSLVSDGLNERKANFLLGQNGSHLDILSPSDSQRQSFLNGGLGSSGLQTTVGRQQGTSGGGRGQTLNGG
ncbi:hypothetical protein AA313_de0208407 [Arthrobotrys entomopaga]|nr:hypothetical protein AA313_de0208407 [Arthrobotrys entomopaga]